MRKSEYSPRKLTRNCAKTVPETARRETEIAGLALIYQYTEDKQRKLGEVRGLYRDEYSHGCKKRVHRCIGKGIERGNESRVSIWLLVL